MDRKQELKDRAYFATRISFFKKGVIDLKKDIETFPDNPDYKFVLKSIEKQLELYEKCYRGELPHVTAELWFRYNNISMWNKEGAEKILRYIENVDCSIDLKDIEERTKTKVFSFLDKNFDNNGITKP